MTPYTNPYAEQSFFGFFLVLFQRLWGWITGQITPGDIASDEVQMAVLSIVAISAACVGVFLVLRKMTMLANSVSHTILLGIVAVYFFTAGTSPDVNIQVMLCAAFVTGLCTAILTEWLTRTARLQEDASTGIVFTTIFAWGIILVTLLTRNAHIGAEVVMGNADALRAGDSFLAFIVLGLNVCLFTLFFKEFKITTFDPGLAASFGISNNIFNYLLMMLASATVISAFRAVGVLMVLAFITAPPLIARLMTHDLKKMLFFAGGIGVFTSIMGVALARHLLSIHDLALSTGGLVVCLLSLFYLVALIISRFPRY